jgi:hypothetical protein
MEPQAIGLFVIDIILFAVFAFLYCVFEED